MSLRLWLPLDGDLSNKGLANPAIPTASVTYSNESKIGSKSLKGSTKAIYNLLDDNISSQNMTIAFWAKADPNPGTSTLWW